jgi:aspartyl/asparaginyl-tRNA synthetase
MTLHNSHPLTAEPAVEMSAILPGTHRVMPSRDRIFIRDLPQHLSERITLHGWLVALRRAKAIRFLSIRDRTGTVQAVYRGNVGLQELDELPPESAIRVTGTVRESAVARFGTIEIEIETIDVLAIAQAPLPLDGNAKPDARLDYRYLDLRPRERALIFEVQTTLERVIRERLLDRGFLEIHTPKITAGGSESGATVFELPYFGQPACLVQSPQFYVQLAMAAGFDRVFETGPVFRAEAAVTNRHATEFTCIDVEISWIDSHEDLMSLEEEILRDALSVVQDLHGSDIKRYCGVTVEIPDSPIPRIPLAFARELTASTTGEAGGRLTHRAEQILSKYALEKYGHSLVFLTNYPAEDRPFYTMQEAQPALGQVIESRSFDLLWGGIEVTSGCQREHRYDRLRAQAAAAGLESDTLTRYLDTYYFEMFRYGCPPHGGFGIGVNRLLMALLGQPSIRETSFIFRGPGRFVP